MTCAHCTKALTDWTGGGYFTDCEGCAIRALARAPSRTRLDAYKTAPGMRAKKELIVAEYKRLQALRKESNGHHG